MPCHSLFVCLFVFLKVLNFSSTFFLLVSKRRLLGIQDLDAAKSHNWAIKVQRMCGHLNGGIHGVGLHCTSNKFDIFQVTQQPHLPYVFMIIIIILLLLSLIIIIYLFKSVIPPLKYFLIVHNY